ncbi:MAG: TRAP transporter small permease [Pseudomonadota bacterium]
MNSWIDRLLLGLHAIGAVFLAAVVGVICFDVIGRLLFNRPFAGTAELTGAGLVLLTFMQAPHAIREGKLLRVTFFLERVPAAVRHSLSALAWTIGTAIFVTFVLAAWEPALSGWKSGEFYGNDAFRLPAWPLRFGTLLLWVLAAAVCATTAVRAMRGQDESLAPPEH